MSTRKKTKTDPVRQPPMKRQLRNRNRSMKHITDLLKSPQRLDDHKDKIAYAGHTPPKKVKSPNKSPQKPVCPHPAKRKSVCVSPVKKKVKKVETIEFKEYYPNKGKRKIEEKKVVLKPNHELKIIGGMHSVSKRKMVHPQKGAPSTRLSRRLSSLPRPPDALLLDAEELDDEDLMEILTCPSPVWWEDAPNEEYDEEPLSCTSIQSMEEMLRKHKEEENSKSISQRTNVELHSAELARRGEKFINKRSKLENLLGNLKKLPVINNKKTDNDTAQDNSVETEEVKYNSESTDGEDTLESMRDDDMLKGLENISIPMQIGDETDEKDTKCDINDDENDVKPSFLTSGKDPSNDNEIKNDIDVNVKLNSDLDVKKSIDDDEIDDKSKLIETIANNKHLIDNNNVLNTVSVFKMNVLSSPISVGSLSEDCDDNTTVDNLDSISDTNIQFLADDDDVRVSSDIVKANEIDQNCEMDTKVSSNEYKFNNDDTANIKIEEKKLEIDVVNNTQIKIKKETETEPNNQENEKKEKTDETLNSFYKKCKNANAKKNDEKKAKCKEKEGEINFCAICDPKPEKTILVANTNNAVTKCCLKCSSIFDSDDCTYCVRKVEMNAFNCMNCGKRYCCTNNFRKHYCKSMFNCESCPFESSNEKSLIEHRTSHKDFKLNLKKCTFYQKHVELLVKHT